MALDLKCSFSLRALQPKASNPQFPFWLHYPFSWFPQMENTQICNLPTVCLSLGEATKPWQGMGRSHLRALEAEPTKGGKLQNWRIGFGNSIPRVLQSCAGVLAKQRWEIKEKMLRCFWSWNEEFPVLLSTGDTSLLKTRVLDVLSQSKHSWSQPGEQEGKEEEPGKVRNSPSPTFPSTLPMQISPSSPFSLCHGPAALRTNLVPQQKMLFIHFHYICASLLLSSLFLVLSCFSSRAGR